MRKKTSIFLKLIGVMALAVLLINAAVMLSFRFGWIAEDSAPQPVGFLGTFSQYVIREIGTPPDTAKARALAEKLDMDIRIESAETGAGKDTSEKPVWETSPAISGITDIDKLSGRNLNAKTVFYKRRLGAFRVKEGEWMYSFALKNFTAPQAYLSPERVVIGLVVTLSLVVFGIYLLLRRMFAPIHVLIAGTERIAAGDFSGEMDVKKNDELGTLAYSFNAMSQRIAAMLRRERDLLRRERELLLDVSHELRSPLTRMNVALELLPDGNAKTQIKKDIAELNTMLTELLESERLAAPHGGLKRLPFDLGALAHEVADEFWDELPRLKVEPVGEPVVCTGDKERLRLVLRNLMSNALKYSQDEVWVRVKKMQSGVSCSVQDSGVGIAAPELEKIFEPFYRTESSRVRVAMPAVSEADTEDAQFLTSRSAGGFGLGLYLCKRIIEAHGGSIKADSRAGLGTTITASLPCKEM